MLFCAASTHHLNAAPPLDEAFGDRGFVALSNLVGEVEALGSCPHADGTITLVGYRPSRPSLVLARLRANGGLDTGFSGDGLKELRLGLYIRTAHSATACAGVGNASSADDRMLITATAASSPEFAVAVLLDLESGDFNPDFALGAPARWDINRLLFPDGEEGEPYPNVRMRGVFPGPNNGWLLVGQLIGETSDDQRGLIARSNATGTLEAIALPGTDTFDSHELNVARVGGDGAIRALGSGSTANSSYAWGLLKLDAATLAPLALLDYAESPMFSYRLYKGRLIGGGLMVAAGVQGGDSPLSKAPRLLIVRENEVSEVVLPDPAPLDGARVGPSGVDGTAAATGASGGRVVFATQLGDLVGSAVGWYAAVVRLGDGGSVADQLDTRFAEGGSASFRLLDGHPSCREGAVPAQRFANLSSWGDDTLLSGTVTPDCTSTGTSWMLGARLSTDPNRILRSGFEG